MRRKFIKFLYLQNEEKHPNTTLVRIIVAEEEEETFGMEVEETVMGGALHHPDRAEDKRMLSAPYPFF